MKRGTGYQGEYFFCGDKDASSFMLLTLFFAQNLYLSKPVDFSNHFLNGVTEDGDGPFGSRSSLGELYSHSDFKMIDQKHTDLARMAGSCLKFASPTTHLTLMFQPFYSSGISEDRSEIF